MLRILTMCFAVVVALMAATIINSATYSATKSFRASFHHASVDNR